MNRYIVTECPACTTRFQVTAGQLKLAGGKVRCGACLEVFNAEVYRCDNLPEPVEEYDSQNLDEKPQSEDAHQKKLSKDPLKDPLFDALDIPAFIDKSHLDTTEDDRTTDQAHDEQLAERLNNSPDIGFDGSTDDLAEPSAPEATQQITEQPAVPQPAFQSIPSQKADAAPAAIAADNDAKPTQWTDPLAQSVAEALQEEALQQETLQPEPHQQQPLQEEPLQEEPLAQVTERLKEQSNDQLPTNGPARAIVPDPEQTRPFTAVRAEPVMIRSTQTHSGINLSGLMLILLAIILFAGQLLWFNRQPLSAIPELTQLYQQACQHLPCKLLPVIDLKQIDTRQLVIQEHTRYQGALSVSLLIENIAPTAQPYPAVLLSFTDRKGKLISQRLFEPEDYLNNRQLNLQQMPAQQMVQISFDILDPGRRAISYEARLEKPRLAAEASQDSWQKILLGRLL